MNCGNFVQSLCAFRRAQVDEEQVGENDTFRDDGQKYKETPKGGPSSPEGPARGPQEASRGFH